MIGLDDAGLTDLGLDNFFMEPCLAVKEPIELWKKDCTDVFASKNA